MKNKKLSIFLLWITLLSLGACKPRMNDHQVLENIGKQNNIVGFSYLAYHQGKIADEYYYGYSNLATQTQVDSLTQYRVASISKTVCAYAILKLLHQGKLDLDTDVSTYLGFSVAPPAHPQWKTTVRELLSHTSNLRDGEVYDDFLSRSYNEYPQPTLKDLFAAHQKDTTALWAAPDVPEHYFAYCNLEYVILGTIVEVLTQQPFYQYVNDSIFIPNGISASFRPDQMNDISHLSSLYRSGIATCDSFATPPTPSPSPYIYGVNAATSAPQGGLRISARELCKVMQLLMQQKEMFQPQWIYNGNNGDTYNGFFTSWGLGVQLFINLPIPTLIGHGGDAYGLISGMMFNPATQSGIIYIFNGYYNSEGFAKGKHTPLNNAEEQILDYSDKYLK